MLIYSLGCGGSEADRIGVGAQCNATNDCRQDVDPPLQCLTAFKGGYCGLTDCQGNHDCPDQSLCVAHGGTNYCFRACADKAECNRHRDPDNESNCSANINRVDGGNQKACVPPSGL